jgi:integrase
VRASVNHPGPVTGAYPYYPRVLPDFPIQIAAYGRSETLLTGEDGGQLSPRAVERAMRKARSEVKSLPVGFRYHDLRHYFASLPFASGADVRTVPGLRMPLPRPPSRPTGTSGPTVTSRPGAP